MYQNIWYIDAKTTANTLDYTGLATIEFVVGSFINLRVKREKLYHNSTLTMFSSHEFCKYCKIKRVISL